MTVGLKKLIGSHPEDLASGRTVAPEEPFESDALARKPTGQDPDPAEVTAWLHDKRLIDEGLIIDAKITPVELEGEALQERARELNIDGRTTMSAARLRKAVAEAEATAPAEEVK